MIHIDSIILDNFLNENTDFFQSARVQKIQQPTRKEVIIQLRNNKETKKFYINIHPDFFHVCFMDKENEKKRNLTIPKQPPMFCMLLRKHMENAKIIKVQKPQYERIIELYFENYNELGDRIEECLSIELMGKHSNIVLYNTDNNIIIGCAHNIGEEKSKERELAGGLPYIYPPKQNKKDISKTKYDKFESIILKSNNSLKKTINQNFFALSQVLVEEICTINNINPEQISTNTCTTDIQKLFIALHEIPQEKTYYLNKAKTAYSFLNAMGTKYQSVNALIDDYYAHQIEKTLVQNKKKTIIAKINKELKKLKNTIDGQKKQLDKKDKIETYLLKGNLLTANSYKLENGLHHIVLNDFETNTPIEIELDETKTIIDNAQRYFALYNKGKKALQIAEEMNKKTVEEIQQLEQILFETEISKTVDELNDILTEIEPEKTKKENKNNEPNIEKRQIGNYTVYIGKNSKQNDYLYSKISSPYDIWFHTLNTPGSHIIAKPQNSTIEMDDETLLNIAKLAKEYSTAKNSTKVAIVYTLRKYIKRPQDTKSGFVVYKNETEIVVN